MRRLLLLLTLAGAAARADEGMWTFDHFPADRVQRDYGVQIDQAWLDHVRLSSARLAQGCSASFVSGQGLVMTNHHCARACTFGVSDAAHDYVRDGFLAGSLAEERRCPALEVNRLEQITDVTRAVHAATDGKEGRAFSDAERAVEAQLKAACATGPDLRCDLVTLYAGGAYSLYRYRRFQDVRLAWAPEDQAANFGGDPDNFEFPRYDLDATLLRVYDNDAPLATPEHLRFGAARPQEGQFVVTSGNPGSTSRDATLAELQYSRDVALPRALIDIAEQRGMLNQFAAAGPDQSRIAQNDLFSLSNSYKALYGKQRALADPAIIAAKAADEAELRRRVAADPATADAAGAWDDIAGALQRFGRLRDQQAVLEGYPRSSRLLGFAITLVRRAAEAGKPEGERLRGYTEADLPALRQGLLSPAPVHADLEEVKLRYALAKMRERLGPDDPLARRLFGAQLHEALAPEALAPEALAHNLATSSLADPAQRLALLEGGPAAIAASTDPAIVFVRDRLDEPARAIRQQVEADISSVLTRSATLIARARFTLDGDRAPPDATFSPRLSYGAVAGYDSSRGGRVAPLTTFAGAFARETGAAPFVLPRSWAAARGALDLSGPLDIASSNDIIGGNSGSPLIDAKGEVVGLIFDGNIESLGGDYVYDGRANRAVSVSIDAIRQALTTIYHADRLAAELAE